MDPVQIQYATALPTAIYSGLAAVLFDGILAENSGFLSYSYSTSVLVCRGTVRPDICSGV
eukprot:COSAG02_NODE_2915_length_7755_cov_3.080329_2_plen_60_part_00